MKKVFPALFALIVTLGLVFGSVPSNAQSNNQLVQKLVELFRDVDNASIGDANQARLNEFKQRFDSQIATLNYRGVSRQILYELQDKKNAVVARASKMTIGMGNIPFIPVIKPSYLGYYGLMTLVQNGGKEGYCHLDPALITDKVETPDSLYYIYDVEDGEAMLGKSPEAAEKLLKQQNRFSLTAAEVVALATHTDILPRQRFVDATGSRYESVGKVPGVYLDYSDRPILVWFEVDNSHDQWGSPSCGSR